MNERYTFHTMVHWQKQGTDLTHMSIYKRIMFFHHLINSDKRRTARKIVVNQMEMDEGSKNWYGSEKEWVDQLGMQSKE